ncbi:uncharacterized protein LOC143288392 isoform X2 [Babylonia areolata]|uniref:uncharacterized protein LOC143288392 isoform X2 n=1 Tax=Babylonia areolata TaxID=304850 RepID=UPI003FD1720D
MTAFDYNNSARRQRLRRERERGEGTGSCVGPLNEDDELQDARVSKHHPLTTRRGKMTLLRERSHRPPPHPPPPLRSSSSSSDGNIINNSNDRSASADSGLGSPLPSPSPTHTPLDKTTHDVISSSCSDLLFDDVTRFSSSENLSSSGHQHQQQHHHHHHGNVSINSSGSSNMSGFFGAYITRHVLSHDTENNKSYSESTARKTFRGALRSLSEGDPALPDAAAAAAAAVSDDAFPAHLDCFADASAALVERLRRNNKRRKEGEKDEEEEEEEGKEEEEEDDEFDERWHQGHRDGHDCPFCREFARATTRGRVDRYFGGTESFLSWIFSKWGKRKELEGSFRRSVGTRGRSPHFCNFVQKAGLHVRPDSAQARTGGGGSDAEEDGRNSLASSEATDNDILAQWRKGRLSNSGTEGRPGSPTSLDGRSRDPGVTSGSNMAGSEDEDVMSAKMIPTITIPSSPIPSGDQMMLSNRSSGESSPRKSAREEPKRPEESSEDRAPKPQHLAVSAPLPASPPKVETRAEKSKRPPVPKKTRKAGGDRRRKSKTVVVMEPVPVETSGSGEPAAATSGDAETRPKTNGVDVSIKVADLPEVSASAKKNGGKPGKRSQRRLIATPPAGGEKLQLPQELLDLDSSSRTGYDFGDLETTLSDSYNNKYRPQSWLSTRMALSKQASRFELPMDMKVLEKITPQDYLKRFCVVTSRRLNLYQKIFNKYKDKANNINKQGLETCLKETLVQQMKDTTFPDLCDLLDITQDTVIDFKLFSGAAAITERILYPHYTTEDTVEKAEYQRDKIETADFEALDWKLHGVKVGEKMTKLLKTIE